MCMVLLFASCGETGNGGNNNTGNDFTGDTGNNGNNTGNDSTESYTLTTYSLTDEYGNAGTYTEINALYEKGSAVELEATVNPGYNFVGWFIGDTCVSEDLKYAFTVKQSNVQIEARYDYFTVFTTSYTDDYEKAGTYTELKNKKISVGETVTLEATVNSGYNFEGWFIDYICVSEDLSYSFVMKEKNMELEARWSYYTVSVDSYTDDGGAAGTFTAKSDEKVSAGETVTLTATVNDGYNFEGWYVDDTCVSEDLTYSFVMKKEDAEVEAKFSCYSVTTYSDTALEGTRGTYTQLDEKKVSAGKTVTLIAEAAQGCNFEGWYVYGIFDDYWRHVCVSEDAEYTFEMGKENVELEARFSAYTLTTSAFLWTGDLDKIDYMTPGINVDFFYSYNYVEYEPSMGDYTQYKNTFVSVGEEITLTATEKIGYTFFGWKRGFDLITTSNTYTFVMEESDIKYEAVYIQNP